MKKLKPKKFKKALRLRLDGLKLAVQSFAVRLFEIEPGGYSPHHSHSWEHEIFVLEGNGVAIGNNGVEAFSVGNVISIPSEKLHQIKNTGKSALKFLFIIPK